MAANTTAPAKKKKSAGSVIISIITIALIAFAGYYVLTNYVLAARHSVKINDKVINLRSSIKDIQDQGFVICNVNGKVITGLDATVRQREIHNTNYFIGVADREGSTYAENTGIRIKVANFNSQNQPLKKCSIYELSYTPEYQKDGVKVLIDDKDMSKASLEDWASFLKEKGFPFSDKELDEFKTGKSKYISGKKDTHEYAASLDATSKTGSTICLIITRDIKVEYKSR